MALHILTLSKFSDIFRSRYVFLIDEKLSEV